MILVENRCRFLIHRWMEESDFKPELTTFSVGEDDQRRLVACFKDLIIDGAHIDHMLEKDKEELNLHKSQQDPTSSQMATKSSRIMTEKKTRRPDKVLYIPRAKRQTGTNLPEDDTGDDKILEPQPNKENLVQNDETTVVLKRVHSPDDQKCKIIKDNAEVDLLPMCDPEPKDSEQSPDPQRQDESKCEILSDAKLQSLNDSDKEILNEPTQDASKSCDSAPVSKPDVTIEKAVKLKKNSCTKEDSWDAKFDDNGDCVDPSILEEITKKVGKVSVVVPEIDYFSLEEKEPDVADDCFGHIIEIYNFPIEYKTQDLISAFHPFKERGFSIKWVDDTHALAIFGSRSVADEAVNMSHPIIKTRPMTKATAASKRKAKNCSEFLQPYKERPQTSTLMVNRLLSGALGMNLPMSKQRRDADRQKLKDAKERKRLAVKQREDAWEGIVNNNE